MLHFTSLSFLLWNRKFSKWAFLLDSMLIRELPVIRLFRPIAFENRKRLFAIQSSSKRNVENAIDRSIVIYRTTTESLRAIDYTRCICLVAHTTPISHWYHIDTTPIHHWYDKHKVIITLWRENTEDTTPILHHNFQWKQIETNLYILLCTILTYKYCSHFQVEIY